MFKTREEYLAIGLPNILKAMKLLREQPGYRFVLDQVAYVKPFLERYPDQEADFRKFLKEGRLQLVGGLDVMPDVNMPGGETFIRQMQYGKGYYRRKLGVEVTAGWLVDTFGHHAQMPQLLTLGGYKSFWFCAGCRGPTIRRSSSGRGSTARGFPRSICRTATACSITRPRTCRRFIHSPGSVSTC